MEGKTPHNTYIKWEEHKEKLRESREGVTIDAFLDFYNKQINMEENAQYLRKPVRPEGRPPRNQEKALMLHTKVNYGKKPYQKNNPGYKKASGFQKKDSAGGKKFPNKWNKTGQKKTTPILQQEVCPSLSIAFSAKQILILRDFTELDDILQNIRMINVTSIMLVTCAFKLQSTKQAHARKP